MAGAKNPTKSSDVNDVTVKIVYFATHLMWLSAFAWNYWSALSYYQFIFGDVVGKGRWGWDKIVVYILHGLVLLWYISSVSHQVPLPHEC